MSGSYKIVECFGCGSKGFIVWEPRYKGLRGICTSCGTNWPES